MSPAGTPRLNLKRLLRWIAGILGLLLLLAIVAVLFRDALFKQYLLRTITARTGLRTELGEVQTRLGRSSVALRDLKIFNGEEFGSGVFISIPELAVELDSNAAGAGALKFRKLVLDLAEVNVVRSKQGRNNLDQLDRAFEPRAGAQGGGGTNRASIQFAGIDYMQLSIGDVQFIDLRRPKRSRKIEVAVRDEIVRDIKSEEELQSWAGAFLFRVFLQEAMKRGSGAGAGGQSGDEAESTGDAAN